MVANGQLRPITALTGLLRSCRLVARKVIFPPHKRERANHSQQQQAHSGKAHVYQNFKDRFQARVLPAFTDG
jgi:hypothetical protein